MIEEPYPKLPPHYTIYRIPADVIQQQRQNLLLSDLLVTRAGYFPQATGHRVARDRFDEYIIIYCLEGAGWFQSNGKRWKVCRGDLITDFPDTAHAYGASDRAPQAGRAAPGRRSSPRTA